MSPLVSILKEKGEKQSKSKQCDFQFHRKRNKGHQLTRSLRHSNPASFFRRPGRRGGGGGDALPVDDDTTRGSCAAFLRRRYRHPLHRSTEQGPSCSSCEPSHLLRSCSSHQPLPQPDNRLLSWKALLARALGASLTTRRQQRKRLEASAVGFVIGVCFQAWGWERLPFILLRSSNSSSITIRFSASRSTGSLGITRSNSRRSRIQDSPLLGAGQTPLTP